MAARNMAQVLVELHDARQVFDFCGGMLFQLVLSDKLRSRLAAVASSGDAAHTAEQPVVFGAECKMMRQTPGWRRRCL